MRSEALVKNTDIVQPDLGCRGGVHSDIVERDQRTGAGDAGWAGTNPMTAALDYLAYTTA